MNRPSDEFQELTKLLALKRHEQPPPGYFGGFAGQVLARLEAEDARRSPSWWQRCWEALTAPPAVALSYGALVLGLGSLGVLLLQSMELESDASAAMAGQPWMAVEPHPTFVTTLAAQPQETAAALDAVQSRSSFSPVLGESAPAFLFNPNGARARLVGYSPR